MTTIGDRIRTAREKKDWTIRRLSDSTGYTENTVGDVERGEYIPTERLLRAIEKALGVKLRK